MKAKLRKAWRQHRRTALLLAAALLLFLGVTWLLEVFLKSRSNTWTSAIQASATISLVVITCAYVALTSHLVTFQKHSARTAAQETSTRELLQLLVKQSADRQAMRMIPFELSSGPIPRLGELADKLSDLGDEIHQKVALLPPRLFLLAAEAAIATIASSSRCYALHTTCIQEASSNLENGSAWSLEGLRARWYMENRDGLEARDEWEELARGDAIKRAVKAIADLETELIMTLQTDP